MREGEKSRFAPASRVLAAGLRRLGADTVDDRCGTTRVPIPVVWLGQTSETVVIQRVRSRASAASQRMLCVANSVR